MEKYFVSFPKEAFVSISGKGHCRTSNDAAVFLFAFHITAQQSLPIDVFL